jgi:predicted TIM-barrel fold metal-dependent hydrolase
VISRRKFLVGSAGAAISPIVVAASGFAPSSSTITPIRFSVPAGACDCQTHVFGDPLTFSFSRDRSYTPEPAPVSELRSLHNTLHIDRVVVVQPTVYGSDNACMLDALRQFGSRARGVVMLGEGVTRRYLDDMERAGVRGIRISLETSGKLDPALVARSLQRAIEQISDRNWHIQIGARLPTIEYLQDTLSNVRVPIVFEHFAHANAPLGLDQVGFKPLLNLVSSGKAYVKISAAYRCCSIGIAPATDLQEVMPFAKALVSANSDRIVWGSDWPHSAGTAPGHAITDVSQPMTVDDGQMLNLLPTWAPDAEVRRKILVENPARLYGF